MLKSKDIPGYTLNDKSQPVSKNDGINFLNITINIRMLDINMILLLRCLY